MSAGAANWAMASLLALLLGAAGQLDDTEPAPSAALAQAQQQARADARAERAAAQLCIRLHGPHAVHRWDVDGRLVCTDRRAPTPAKPAGRQA